MDLVYRLNSHSKFGQVFRKIFQPVTYLFIGSMIKTALFRHRLKIINRDALLRAWKDRPPGTPLITVSNHHSCLDDFILFGSLFSLSELTKVEKFRWTLTAVDICFKNPLHSYFFSWGKGIPIWRTVRDINSHKLIHMGGGVDQPSMNFAIQILNQGGWVHIFPQGRIIHPFEFDGESNLRLRWGIGRLLAESNVLPLVLPIWHCGLELLNPSEEFDSFETLRRIIGKPQILTIAVGETINPDGFRSILSEYQNHHPSFGAETRCEMHSLLTALVQTSLYSLKTTTELVHEERSYASRMQ